MKTVCELSYQIGHNTTTEFYSSVENAKFGCKMMVEEDTASVAAAEMIDRAWIEWTPKAGGLLTYTTGKEYRQRITGFTVRNLLIRVYPLDERLG